ncbi:MAG: sugar ABC transporter ATP-binding protein [Candidatus Bipolaricaulota bacterium]
MTRPHHPASTPVDRKTPPAQTNGARLVRMTGISKQFPGVIALDRVDFDLRGGEIHALLGANGAGKSTLIKILSGVYRKDTGTVEVRGQPVDIRSPSEAQHLGIATIYQEYNLVPDLSVAENICLGHIPRGSRWFSRSLISRRQMVQHAEQILGELQVEIPAITPLRQLGVAKQQMVEIAKALSLESEIYIMDEPTAALSSKEIEELFRVARSMRDRGCAIIYISHRLEEVGRIADRVTVMRDGRRVETLEAADAPTPRLVQLMVGHEVEKTARRPSCETGGPVLAVEGLHRKGVFEDVSFHICQGEIVGLAGVMGSGRTEVARAIFGADRLDSGQVHVSGKPVRVKSPNQAVQAGLCYLPEDRKGHGLVLSSSVRDNVVLASLSRFSRFRIAGKGIILDQRRIRKEVMDRVHSLDIKTPGIGQLVQFLSGGNQQKVVVARWLCSSARVFLFDEPTRGIDVGAKSEIYGLVRTLAEQGAGILLISSEVEELVDMCDRIYVLRQGRIVGELPHDEISKEAILAAALTGVAEKSGHRHPMHGGDLSKNHLDSKEETQ